MPRRPTGVLTIPGYLTSQLEDLDVSRKELAAAAGASVRTIHNIEHGRKRVAPAVIDRVAAVLNRRSALLFPTAEPPLLTRHRFIASTPSVINVAMQAIVANRPEFLLEEHALVDPALRWWINGDPERLTWTGDFDLVSLAGQIDTFHRSFEHLGVEDTRLYLSRQENAAVVKTVSSIRHRSSGGVLNYLNYIEFRVGPRGLHAMEATFDTDLVTEFAVAGAVRARRRRDLG